MRYLLLCCCFPALLSAQSNFLKDPDIVWAKEIEMDWVVDVASFEKVLGDDLKTPFYDYLNEKPLTPAERSAMLARIDTVVTYDPETYEEKVQVVRNELNTDDIQQVQLVHQWYWDEKRSRLSIVLEAVGMMHEVNNYYGEYRYTTPLFYRRINLKS